MLKLRILLLSNKPFIIIIVLISLLTILRINIKPKYNFTNETTIKGIVTDIYIKDLYLKMEIRSKDKLIANYYFKNNNEKNKFNIDLGDTVILKGNLETPSNNTVFNNFNYKSYLYHNNIYKVFKINKYKKIKQNTNIYYTLKNIIIKHINKYKTKSYLHAFILGNTKYLKKDVKKSLQDIGISHLFAISGAHISLLSGIILILLQKVKIEETKRYIITTILLFIYLLLSFSPSVLRSFLFFTFLSINKIYYFHIKPTNIFLLTLATTLLINPFFIYNTGFIFSFSISLALIISSKYFHKDSYIIQLLQVSLISFLVSLPIIIYNYYQINLLSIIYNIIFVPLISSVIFPLTLITFIIPILDPILFFIINIFEKSIILLNSINILKLVFSKPSMLIIGTYYILIFSFITRHKKVYIIILIIILTIHYNSNLIFNKIYFITMDVGQGDSTLIHNHNNNILIDTGGIDSYNHNTDSGISSRAITLLKSLGIRKLQLLLITHGDFDHMGEAINLVNNFKVEKVIFNCGPYNDLEKELIKVLDKKKIKYYSCIKELNIDKNKLYFLQTKEYDNENDNSNVIYTELNGYKFMFMGDASITTEKEILDKYNLSDIDVLKVGHHGSKTSSSKDFINEINPKYSIISVGKNNRYGHPNKEVLNNLKNSKIFRTDQNGSIMFKIKNNKLKIETCNP